MSSELARKSCVPCQGGVPKLSESAARELLAQLPGDWEVVDGHHLERRYAFPDFLQALAAVNRIGALAEEQGHHPELGLGWGHVDVQIWTHKIDGLTESDFILAAKIEEIV